MNGLTRRAFALLLLLTSSLMANACAPTPAPSPTPVTVQLQWTHQAQFAGLYAAKAQGYYGEEGLEVTFLEGGANVDRLSPVFDGTAQISMATADEILLWRAEGQPVRAFSTIYRRSPIVFFSLKQAGITRPEDFAGKTIRVSANLVPSLHAMTARVGLTPDQYTEVVLPSDLAAFATGEVPVWGGFSNGFLVSVESAGYEVNAIYPDDYGVHFYADTLFATDDFIAGNADTVERFLRATLKGWTWAVENPSEAAAVVLQYNPSADLELETRKMIASLPLVNTGEDFIGWMRPEVWAGMKETLEEQEVLTTTLDITQVYTMQPLNEIYQK